MSRRILPTVRTVTLLIVGMLAVGFVAYGIYDGATRSRSADDRATIRAELDSTRSDLDDQKAATAALADQVESLGEEPVVEPNAATDSVLVPIPGPRGPGPTLAQIGRVVAAQIDAALEEACDGSCVGPQGDTVVGPPGGPGPKGDTGAKGDAGDDGADGADGRGIERVACLNRDGEFVFVIFYTDDTSQDVTGSSCRAALLPAPEPTPAP